MIQTNFGRNLTGGEQTDQMLSEVLKFNIEEKPLLGFWATNTTYSVKSLGPILVNVVEP